VDNKEMNRIKKIILLIFLGSIFILIGILTYLSKKESIQVIPSPVPTQSQLSNSNSNFTYAKVTRVIDGDTIVIDTGQHVRYIGMNTPEVETSECYATEASEINKNLVLGKEVKLEKDVSETDKYDRLLRYVYVGDTFVDDYLVKDGAAKIMTVPPDVEYKDEFLSSQNYAKENELGLWGKCP
jgi:micrococcal nuclease